MTNAVKAGIIAAVNAALAIVVSFGINLTSGQQASILAGVNAALALWVALSYKNSPKRVPDA